MQDPKKRFLASRDAKVPRCAGHTVRDTVLSTGAVTLAPSVEGVVD